MRLSWDKIGERFFRTGVDHGVLFIPNNKGDYEVGYAWSGLTTVTESPSGAESNPQYADNMKYLNLKSAEEFGLTIEALFYPPEFGQCDGTAEPVTGVILGQQRRRSFGFSYRTLLGNDIDSTDYGSEIHLVYGCDAAPSEKTNATVNESPEAGTFSWEVTTTGVAVTGFKPTSHITVNTTKVPADRLEDFLDILYGTPGSAPRMPLPDEVIAMFGNDLVEVRPLVPTFNEATNTITIPVVTGVVYTIDDEPLEAGPVVISEDVLVVAKPTSGNIFPDVVDNTYVFTYVAP